MAKFTEALNVVKEHIKTLMTKENISNEELTDLATLNSQVDEVGIQYQALVDSNSKMKDKYIEAITKYGTTTLPKDEEQNSGAEKTFEQCVTDVLAKGK